MILAGEAVTNLPASLLDGLRDNITRYEKNVQNILLLPLKCAARWQIKMGTHW